MIQVGLDYGGRPYSSIPLPIIDGEDVTDVLFTAFCRDLFIQIDTTNLGSGESLTFTVEGSLNGTNFDNLSATNATIDITTSGFTLVRFPGALPAYVRVAVDEVEAEDSTMGYSIEAYIAVINP